ncbi:MAG TPA: PIN domain-containing protein [Bryobacteraceae bacterium]|nr:PIN domain-containing protein [Bryobacteraceae bacterium]
MTVLIDTDVLLDIALNREPHAAASAQLLEALERGAASGFIAWHSLSNFHYLVSPLQGAAEAKEFLLDLLHFVGVAQTSTASAAYAAGLPMKDFEDALQVAAAAACGADVIATRNIRDYTESPVKAELPSDLLQRIG